MFCVTEIATLAIPHKMRGVGEIKRLPVQIHSILYPSNYSLVSRWGRLRGLFRHEDLNKETEETEEESHN